VILSRGNVHYEATTDLLQHVVCRKRLRKLRNASIANLVEAEIELRRVEQARRRWWDTFADIPHPTVRCVATASCFGRRVVTAHSVIRAADMSNHMVDLKRLRNLGSAQVLHLVTVGIELRQHMTYPERVCGH